jgi:hypothetical protein
LSGCYSESYIMQYTFLKGFNSDQLQSHIKQMLEIATCLYAKIYFKIRRRTSSGCHSESYIMRYTFIKGFNSDQLQFQRNRCYKITKCNLFIFKNWLQNSPPDFVRLLLWVIHHAIHIFEGFQQWSASISPKQMLEIATCLYAKIDFKIRRRTLSGCHSESYIMRYTFIKGFSSDQLQSHQNRR